MKKDLIRVTFPAKQVAAARELGKPEHASVAQIARRALQKEIDRMQQQQSQKAWRQEQRDQGK
jgi:hypothetical protein